MSIKPASPHELYVAQAYTEHYVRGLEIGRTAVSNITSAYGITIEVARQTRSIDNFPKVISDTFPFEEAMGLQNEYDDWGVASAILSGWETGVRYQLEKRSEEIL